VLLLCAAPLFAQRDSAQARGRGRGGDDPGAGRGSWTGPMDSVRVRQLYVSKNPADLRGCQPAACQRGLDQKRRTDSIYTAKAATGVFEFKKIRYKSRPDGLEIPAYLFAPVNKGTAKHAALVWVHGGVHGDWDAALYPFLVEAVKRGYVVVTP